MSKLTPALRFVRLSTTLKVLPLVLLSLPFVAYGDEWKELRCREIQNGLTNLEQRAPKLREEIAKLERELGLLQSFQRGGQTVYLSTIINHVPVVAVAVVGSLTGMRPEFADVVVNRVGDLQAYVNQREIRVRITELPLLQEEQTNVGRQIFLLRDELESLQCPSAGGDETRDPAKLLQRIAGEWQIAETGNFVRIEPENNRAILLETAENTFGFEEGGTVLSKFRVAGDVIEAEFAIYASKDDCPSLRPVTVTATINVQPGGGAFTLTAPNYAYCTDICKWTDEKVGTIQRTFKRPDG